MDYFLFYGLFPIKVINNFDKKFDIQHLSITDVILTLNYFYIN
jgi:hypothetical protein